MALYLNIHVIETVFSDTFINRACGGLECWIK